MIYNILILIMNKNDHKEPLLGNDSSPKVEPDNKRFPDLLKKVEAEEKEKARSKDNELEQEMIPIDPEHLALSQVMQEPDPKDLIVISGGEHKQQENNNEGGKNIIIPKEIYLKNCQDLKDKFFDAQPLKIEFEDKIVIQKYLNYNLVHNDYIPQLNRKILQGLKDLNQASVQAFAESFVKKFSLKDLQPKKKSRIKIISKNPSCSDAEIGGQNGSDQKENDQLNKELQGAFVNKDMKFFLTFLQKSQKKRLVVQMYQLVDYEGKIERSKRRRKQIYLKKLQIYDIYDELEFEILTEQILINKDVGGDEFEGPKEDKISKITQPYQASVIQFNSMPSAKDDKASGTDEQAEKTNTRVDRVYFFMRIYESEQSSKLQLHQYCLKDHKPQENNPEEKQQKNTKPLDFFFREDLTTKDNKQESQYNAIFSQQLDRQKKDNFNDEAEFLKSQFILLQQYQFDCNDVLKTKIYKVSSLKKQTNINDKNDEDLLVSTTVDEPVQFFGHVQNKKDQTVFVVRTINKLYHFLMKEDGSTEAQCKPESQMTYSQKQFNRINQPFVNVHNTELYDQKLKEFQKIIFFINPENEIDLLYPCIDNKLDLLEKEDEIKNKNNIKAAYRDRSHYKRIFHGSTDYKNVIHENETLKKILPIEREIDKDDVFVFCTETTHEYQTLYISSQETHQIDIINMSRSLQKQISNDEPMELTKEQFATQNLKQKLRDAFSKMINKQKHKNAKREEKMLKRQMTKQSTQEYTWQDAKQLWTKATDQILQKQKDIDFENILLDKNQKQRYEETEDIHHHHNQVKNVVEIHSQDKTYKDIPIFGGANKDSELKMTLICYQTYYGTYSFVFEIEQTQKALRTYLFFQKNRNEMEFLFQNYKTGSPLIADNDEVFILYQKDKDLVKCLFQEVETYFGYFRSKDSSNFLRSNEDEFDGKFCMHKFLQGKKFVKAKLSSDRVHGLTNQNFIPLIYQELNDRQASSLLIFDILTCRFSTETKIIQPSDPHDKFHRDQTGYNCFTLCQSSRVFDDYRKGYGFFMARYQVFIFYQEKVGRISAIEFLVKNYDREEALNQSKIEIVGIKELLFSQKLIENCDFQDLINSRASPCWNDDDIVGCRFQVLKRKAERDTKKVYIVNLLDRSMKIEGVQDEMEHNLFTIKTDLAIVGTTKLILDRPEDYNDYESKEYILMASSRINKEIIQKNMFKKDEIYSILERTTKKMFAMKVPDMQYILLNTFEDLQRNYFFQPQQILGGMNICDICLSDANSVQEGLKNHLQNEKDNQPRYLDHLENLIDDYQYRKQALIDAQIYPKFLVVNQDLNLRSTIHRADDLNATMSLKLLLTAIFDKYNTIEYQRLIMFDLFYLWQTGNSEFIPFLGRSTTEKRDLLDENYCNMELPLKDVRLPHFTNKKLNTVKLHKVEEDYPVQDQIIDFIKSKGKPKKEVDKSEKLEAEYFFIDFKDFILGNKIRAITDPEQKKVDPKNFEINDLLLAESIDGIQDERYFEEETIQKIITYQFESTSIYMQVLFFIYAVGFILCFLLSMVPDLKDYQHALLRQCFIQQIIFISIEFTQIRHSGPREYFSQGWNLVDFFQFFLFLCLFYFSDLMDQFGYKETDDTSVEFRKELEFIMFILAFFKTLYFIRIFDSYGSFIQMIQLCGKSLLPFLVCYILFMLGFTICFMILHMEIDSEISEAVGLNYAEYALLQVFRTSMGELAMPGYQKIYDKKTKFAAMNIWILWILWYISVFFMLVIMLNFLIAEITMTYMKVIEQKDAIQFRQKAGLNLEYQIFKNFYVGMKPFKVLAFICSKQEDIHRQDEVMGFLDSFKKFVTTKHETQVEHCENVKHQIDGVKKEVKRLSDSKDAQHIIDKVKQDLQGRYDDQISLQVKTAIKDKMDTQIKEQIKIQMQNQVQNQLQNQLSPQGQSLKKLNKEKSFEQSPQRPSRTSSVEKDSRITQLSSEMSSLESRLNKFERENEELREKVQHLQELKISNIEHSQSESVNIEFNKGMFNDVEDLRQQLSNLMIKFDGQEKRFKQSLDIQLRQQQENDALKAEIENLKSTQTVHTPSQQATPSSFNEFKQMKESGTAQNILNYKFDEQEQKNKLIQIQLDHLRRMVDTKAFSSGGKRKGSRERDGSYEPMQRGQSLEKLESDYLTQAQQQIGWRSGLRDSISSQIQGRKQRVTSKQRKPGLSASQALNTSYEIATPESISNKFATRKKSIGTTPSAKNFVTSNKNQYRNTMHYKSGSNQFQTPSAQSKK